MTGCGDACPCAIHDFRAKSGGERSSTSAWDVAESHDAGRTFVIFGLSQPKNFFIVIDTFDGEDVGVLERESELVGGPGYLGGRAEIIVCEM